MADNKIPIQDIKIFISSPGDLKSERAAITELVREFNEDPVFRVRYKFISYAYENITPAMMGKTPQKIVDETMIRPRDTDLVVCMFWSRFGSPVNAADINPYTNQTYQS